MAVFAIGLATVLAITFMLELRALPQRSAQALYLVSRVGLRHGFEVREKPLSLVLPWSNGAALHFHLLGPGEERDAIVLVAERGSRSRLGNLVIDSDPARVFTPGLRRLPLGVARLDRAFRLCVEPEREDGIAGLLAQNGELLFLIRDLACRSRRGRFQLVDLHGRIKIQVDDRSLRFPSDVERVSLDLVRVYELYRELAGERD